MTASARVIRQIKYHISLKLRHVNSYVLYFAGTFTGVGTDILQENDLWRHWDGLHVFGRIAYHWPVLQEPLHLWRHLYWRQDCHHCHWRHLRWGIGDDTVWKWGFTLAFWSFSTLKMSMYVGINQVQLIMANMAAAMAATDGMAPVFTWQRQRGWRVLPPQSSTTLMVTKNPSSFANVVLSLLQTLIYNRNLSKLHWIDLKSNKSDSRKVWFEVNGLYNVYICAFQIHWSKVDLKHETEF